MLEEWLHRVFIGVRRAEPYASGRQYSDAVSELENRLAEDREARQLPPGLFERLRADPARAPEYVALAAAQRHAPAAQAWIEQKRSLYDLSAAELGQMAKKRHAALARFSGAATGVGGIITFLPDLAAAAWVQSRMVFFIAASYGYDPYDRMRPAELLVLHDIYETPTEARTALDGAGRSIASSMLASTLQQRDEALAKRLALTVGRRAVRRVGARLIPGLAIAVNAIGNERDTRALADRAIAFYGG